MKQYLVMDLGKTSASYAVVNEELDFSNKGKVYTSVESKKELFRSIKEVTDEFKGEVEGLSISMPGVIDHEHGFAFSGGMYTWVKDMEYAKELSEYIHMPVAICNDAKASALAEMTYGSLKKVQNGVLMLILATGIGGAVIADGKILNGQHFATGEFSYLRGDFKGRDGVNDMFALANSLDNFPKTIEEFTGKTNLNLFRIFSMIHEGDEEIKKGVEKFCDMLATFIYNIQCIVDAERFVIGGNVTDEPLFMAMIKEAIDRKFAEAPYQNIYKPEVRGCVFSGTSRMIGALSNYRRYVEKEN